MTTERLDSAVDFTDYLAILGVSIHVKGESLLISPPGRLRDGDADFIRANKSELLEVLANESGEQVEDYQPADAPPIDAPPPQPIVPPGATIVVADAAGYTDESMKGTPYMWTWIDAKTWYYVKDYPIPKMKKGKKWTHTKL